MPLPELSLAARRDPSIDAEIGFVHPKGVWVGNEDVNLVSFEHPGYRCVSRLSQRPKNQAGHPGKSNRKKRIRHDKSAYKNRNVIERCFGRLKDFRRIATRYDKLAGNFFSALCLVSVAGAAKKHSRN